MAKNSGIYQAYDFTRGINKKRPQYLIDDNQLVQMVNCTFDTPGLITSRLGCTKYNYGEVVDGSQFQWCSRFYDKNGTDKYTFVVVEESANDKLYVGDDATEGAYLYVTTMPGATATVDCSDLTGWTDGDTGNGESTQVTFDSKSCFKLDTHAHAANNKALRYKDVGTIGDTFVVEFSIYPTVAMTNTTEYFMLIVDNGVITLQINAYAGRLYVHNGSTPVAVSSSTYTLNSWNSYRLVVNGGTVATATCDVYELVGSTWTLRGSGVDCSYASAFVDGQIRISQFGQGTTDDIITYLNYITIDDNGYIYSPNLTEITGGSALTKGSAYTSVSWRDTLFLTNGVEAIQTWTTGTTRADITGTPTPPTGKYIEQHTERLFLGGNATYPSRLYYCETGDETDWPALNYMDVGEDDGGIITGVAELGQTLLIAKDNGWHRLWGNTATTWDLKKVLGMPGCIAPRSLAKAIGGIMWLASEGVYYYDGANMKDLSSESVEPILKNITGSNLSRVVGIYYDAKYILCYPDNASYNNKAIVYDFRTGGWSQITQWNIASLMWWHGGTDNGELYAGDANGGYLYRLYHGYSDCGTAIPVTLETKHVDGGAPGNVKQWNNIIIHALSDETGSDITITPFFEVDQPQTSMTVSASSSNTWGSVVWGAFTWGGGGIRRTRLRNVNPSKSTTMGFQVTWNGTTAQMYFRGFSVEFDVMTSKR